MQPLTQPIRAFTLSTLILTGFALTAFAVYPPGDYSPHASDDIPAWAMDHMTRMIGRWVTSNAAYQSEEEPYDAYGMEWAWGLGQQSMTGRLFGLQEGKEVGTFWEFRVFWHPGEQQLKMMQFGGNGTVGVGSIEDRGEHKTEALQTFYAPDGSASRIGHREELMDGERHAHSFDVDENGVWTARRSYVWQKKS